MWFARLLYFPFWLLACHGSTEGSPRSELVEGVPVSWLLFFDSLLSDIYSVKAYDIKTKKEITSNLVLENKNFKLSLKYKSDPRISEEKTYIYYYKDKFLKDNSLSTIDKDKLLISEDLNHLTDFAVLGDKKSTLALFFEDSKIILIPSLFLIFSGLSLLLFYFVRLRKNKKNNYFQEIN